MEEDRELNFPGNNTAGYGVAIGSCTADSSDAELNSPGASMAGSYTAVGQHAADLADVKSIAPGGSAAGEQATAGLNTADSAASADAEGEIRGSERRNGSLQTLTNGKFPKFFSSSNWEKMPNSSIKGNSHPPKIRDVLEQVW